VVAISYRGYGHSSGTPSEKGILLDSQTAFDYIKSHPIFDSSPIFLYGQSLGGAVAIGLAANKINKGKIAGVILENTFANLVSLSFPCTQKRERKEILMIFLPRSECSTSSIAKPTREN
jgi:alpha-beta hydrolase superfamily lysophospholipase